MTWILMEGIDRTGKSTVAELYKQRGFEVVHMSAPNKKYKDPGYTGPSYLDDMLEMYLQYDNQDVIFDRTVYGEVVWPHVYGRTPMLSEDDIEVLQEFEDRNNVERILMVDPDPASHWERCVANKEPMNPSQFRMAGALFNKMAHKYNFIPRQLKDYADVKAKDTKPASADSKQEDPKLKGQAKPSLDDPKLVASAPAKSVEEDELTKLAKANAIRDVLSKRILKQKGGTFDKLEEELKGWLRNQLSDIFTPPSQRVSLSEEEVTVLKIFCQRLKEKEGKK